MPNHQFMKPTSKILLFCNSILLMFFAGSIDADTIDPDLTLFSVQSDQLAAEDALLTDEPSAAGAFALGRRPFSHHSIWNTRVDDTFYTAPLRLHEQSANIITFMAETTSYTDAAEDKTACRANPNNAKIRFANTYIPPVHLTDSSDPTILAYVKGEPGSKSPVYNHWDTQRDYWVDAGQATPLYKWENGIRHKLWGEPEWDGHIVVVDPNSPVNADNTEVFDPPLIGIQYGKVWEMSRYRFFKGRFCISATDKNCTWNTENYLGNIIERPTVSTYTTWSLAGKGYGNLPTHDKFPGTNTATFWQHFGGRGSGMSTLGGMLRLAEFNNKTINHALAFIFPMNRTGILNRNKDSEDAVEIFVYPPATRSDGQFSKTQQPTGDGSSYNVAYCQKRRNVSNPYGRGNPAPYPLEGMRLRLKDSYIHPYKKTRDTARQYKMDNLISALKKYGMFLVDNGGPMALEIELLATESTPAISSQSIRLDRDANAKAWIEQSGVDIYAELAKIPVSAFEALDYGLQAMNPDTGNTAPITGKPYMMSDDLENAKPCCWKNYPNP